MVNMDYSDPFFLLTLLVSVAVILAAYVIKKIDLSAVFASALVGFVVTFALLEHWQLIYLVVGFFVLGNLATKYRHSVKEKYQVAEGVRSFRNVFGNGAAAAIFAAVFFLLRLDILLLGVVGAMAAATADTFATEIGQAHEKRPRLITSFKPVDVGTSGAVSSYGLVASFAGAFFTAAISAFFGFGLGVVAVGAAAGFFGCLFDSVVGATLEKKMLDTHLTNFFATSFAGLCAVAFGLIFGVLV
jgi:uncharacterized protein (TIGR00297 family)